MGIENLTVVVHVEWRPSEPDYGVTCVSCGEQVFGAFRQLFVRVNDERPQKIAGHKVCEGCYDVLRNSE
jgi:hypothetical protein